MAAASDSSAVVIPTAPVPLLLDCDPGHDDAMALIMALGHSWADLRLVTTSAGNVPISSTTRNAKQILHACGRPDIRVTPGSSRPLLADPIACHEVHGVSGMDGFDNWPPLDAPLPPHPRRKPSMRILSPGCESGAEATTSGGALAAVTAMASEIHAAGLEAEAKGTPRPVLVATGPLTNVALLLRCCPDVVTSGHLARIVLMGGSTGLGNTSPAAEFNIEVDPQAAAVVFGAARPGAFEAEAAVKSDAALAAGDTAPAPAPDCVSVVMVPLDVTHTAIFTEEHRAQLADLRKRRASAPEGWKWRPPEEDVPAMADGLLRFFASTYETLFGFRDGPPVHDPCAVLCACRPELFEVKQCRTVLETTGVCAGRTVVDVLGVMGPPVMQTAATSGGAVEPDPTAAAAPSHGLDVGAASFKGASGVWAKAPIIGVALSMDVGAFWEQMLDALAHMDSVSPLSLQPV